MNRKGKSLARETLEGRIVGGKFSELASYSDLFKRAQDGILFVDVRNQEILETNDSFRNLIETEHSNEGMIFFDLFPDLIHADLRAWLFSAQTSFEVETEDERVIELNAARVRLADYCEVFQIIVRDITKERVKQKNLESQSLTDEMTGLSNFRAFRSRLLLEHERANKKSKPYCIVFFDVDHFKHYNDRNGHPAGDEVLRELAKIFRKVQKNNVFLARYGGEEFVALLPDTPLDEGRRFAEEARKKVENQYFHHGKNQPLGKVSVSVGVSVYEKKISPDELLKQADEALYESKRSGRNCVTVYLPPQSVIPILFKKKSGN